MKIKCVILIILCFLGGLWNVSSQTTKKIFLSGKDFEHPVRWDFMCNGGNNANQWTTINVPSQWELEGFGEYTYGRWYKELNQKEPSKEEGFYKYNFEVPKLYKNQKVTIVFGGAMTDTEVKINGKLAGDIHQGGFYEFKYDITSLLNYGSKNLLEVHVWKHSANESVNNAERKADWWLFGGIYRPVWIEIKPETHISHAAVDAKMDGSLSAHIDLENITKGITVEATLASVESEETFKSFNFPLKKGITKAAIKMQWKDIKPWSPETPNLYYLTLQLKKNNKVIHEHRERIGFRTLQFIKKDGIYVNGTKIVMKGVNRHTIWPESGRSTSKAISIKDVNLIKDMNMNAVRGHYPPNEHFLGVCDSLGLFVLDELAGWQNPYDTRVGRKLVKEMVVRDVNHPSVIIWDNGNEGGWNTEIEDVFTENDPQQRIVIHPWADYNGWDTHHYPTYLTGIHRFVNGENVFFPTEFMHGTYDHGLGAGLEDFWDRFKKSPLFAGGFLWAYVDESLKISDWTGSEKYDSKGSLAADGILGPHREKEGSFFTIKEVWAPIQFKPLLITSTFKGRLFVTNDYLYTNLNECSVTYKVVKVSDQVFNENINKKNIDEGIFVLPSIKPGETKEVQLPVPHDFFEGDWLEIMAKDKYGREIYTWSWPIHNAAYYAQKLLPETIGNGLKTSVTQNENEITLSGGGVICKIDAKNGRVINISNENNTIPLTNGPVFIGMVAEVKNIEVYKESGNVVCKVNYNGGVDHVLWILYPDGRLHMKMNVLKNEGRNSGFDGAFFEDKIDKFGITFDYPENIVEEIKWLGNGPYRVWKNRIKGTTFGLWKKEYNNTITGESFSQLIYPEFKGYHANLIAANIKAKDQGFKVVSASEKIFLRLFTPELPKNAFPGIHLQPDFPKGDISFLYEIPAIRSFKPLEHQGPESQPSNIRIKKGDEGIYMDLWFDFRQQ